MLLLLMLMLLMLIGAHDTYACVYVCVCVGEGVRGAYPKMVSMLMMVMMMMVM